MESAVKIVNCECELSGKDRFLGFRCRLRRRYGRVPKDRDVAWSWTIWWGSDFWCRFEVLRRAGWSRWLHFCVESDR